MAGVRQWAAGHQCGVAGTGGQEGGRRGDVGSAATAAELGRANRMTTRLQAKAGAGRGVSDASKGSGLSDSPAKAGGRRQAVGDARSERPGWAKEGTRQPTRLPTRHPNRTHLFGNQGGSLKVKAGQSVGHSEDRFHGGMFVRYVRRYRWAER